MSLNSNESNPHLQPDQLQAAQTQYRELCWRLAFLRTMGPEPEPEPTTDQIMDWYKRVPDRPKPLSYNQAENEPKTINQHFSHLFPDQTAQFGQAFLEVGQRDSAGQIQATPVCINHDVFAASLSDPGLGLDVVYFEPDMQFYYSEPFLNIYKPVSAEKLQGLYRGLLMRSANLQKTTNAKLNIWAEFRSDKNARLVIQRTKSILAVDSSFFSATSPHTRIRGIELHERVARRFVDELLVCERGQIMLLTDAFSTFCNLLKEHSLEPVKRADFKALVVPMIKQQFDVCLRNDLRIDERQGVRGWKNLRLSQTVPA